MTRDARSAIGGTRTAREGLWPKWWAGVSRSDKRKITTSSYPVRVVDGKVVRLPHDH